jgi:UDP:flavonoid glycosyltransferase YjiC (YdhE family)
MDCLFHKIIPDLVLSPTLIPSLPQFGGHFHRINPIMRRGYDPALPATPPRKVVIMLSGSVFGSPVALGRTDYPVTIDIVGRDAPADWKPVDGVRYHGKVRDTRDILVDADLAVVNGGFSAVSEMVCMRKPVVVIPVPRHAEQWINARTIEHLGFGLMATDDNFEEAMLSALDRIGDFRAAYDARGPMGDGAAEAALKIIEIARA